MDALCASTYPELLEAAREVAERERRRGLTCRVLDHMHQHTIALGPIERLVNMAGSLSAGMTDPDVAALFREAAEDHERLAKVLWAYARDMAPVRVLEAAE